MGRSRSSGALVKAVRHTTLNQSPLHVRVFIATTHLAVLATIFGLIGILFSNLSSASWKAFLDSVSPVMLAAGLFFLLCIVACVMSPQSSIRKFGRFLMITAVGLNLLHWLAIIIVLGAVAADSSGNLGEFIDPPLLPALEITAHKQSQNSLLSYSNEHCYSVH
jgi:H+/Cl- antiporter ClcA